MPTVQLIYYTHKVNKDGTSPIVIQVNDGKRIKRTLANVLPSQWSEKAKRVKFNSHPNYSVINIKISNEYNRIDGLILSGKFDLQRDFIDYFNNIRAGSELVIDKGEKTFTEIIPLYISTLKSGHSMLVYESRLKYFAKCVGCENLPLSTISKSHFDLFVKDMESEGNSKATMRTKLRIVRFIFSFAFKAGISPLNPVIHQIKLPTAERAVKNKLTKTELAQIENLDYSNNKVLDQIKDMFLLSVYLRGMRVGDIIQLKQAYFKNGRLIYTSGKNKKHFNIKLIPAAEKIVNKYLDKREHLFTYFKHQDNETASHEQNLKARAKHVEAITALGNLKLKEIGRDAKLTKLLSFHIARHTFAKIALEKINDINISMDLIGHSNIKEHQLYIREISETEDLDKAADDIFS